MENEQFTQIVAEQAKLSESEKVAE